MLKFAKKEKNIGKCVFFCCYLLLEYSKYAIFISWKVSDLTPFLRIEQIYKFPKEFLLCAELKHKTKPMKLETAMQKMKQYKELVKQGVMS